MEKVINKEIYLLIGVGLIALDVLLIIISKWNSIISSMAIFIILYALAGFRIVFQYEKGLLFTLGKYSGMYEPGIVWYFPKIQKFVKVDIRVKTADLPKQEVITKDNVPVKINATVFFRVQYPDKAILNVEDYSYATIMYAQTVLRDVIGGVDLDGLLEKRDKIAEEIRKIVDKITDEWGVDVTGVRLQDIELPEEMRRAMARQAEAERERRAVIIKSEGEIKAAENLVKAAEKISKQPSAINLRTLHTLAEISSDPNEKFVFVLPLELLKGFMERERKR